jgi:hypothetical protein
MPCSSRKSNISEEYISIFQSWRLTQASFDPEDGGDTFHWNVRLFPSYTALEHKEYTLHSCCCKNLKYNILMLINSSANITDHYYLSVYIILSTARLKLYVFSSSMDNINIVLIGYF